MIHRSVLSGVHKQKKNKTKKTTSNNRQVCKSLPRLTMNENVKRKTLKDLQKELLPEITFKRLQESLLGRRIQTNSG